jgi:CBS domain-containing protein
MKVQDIMTKEVACCGPETNLASAVDLMWTNDCGALPVVEKGRVVGILTDRDICIALGTRNRPAAEVTAATVATGDVETCSPDSDIHAAMAVMRRAKVRRIPVIDHEGVLLGLVGLNDIILAVDRTHGGITYEEVMNTVKAVSEHRSHRAEGGSPAAAAVA